MKLQTNKLAIATAIAFSILWVICSAFIALIPDLSISLTGAMLHANLSAMAWTLTWFGFFVGLVAWALLGVISAWLIAYLYNRSLV